MSGRQSFLGLSSIALLSDAETRSISAENPTGEKGGGAQAEPGSYNVALGKGWKCRPAITLEQHATTTLADIQGPGTIQHIWITVDTKAYRDCVLRFYWDNEETPSVEAPLGDFFAVGHGLRYNLNSLPVAVNPNGGFNCYWPMPFRERARITIENQRAEAIHSFFYQITYELAPVPREAAYFHAQWRRKVVDLDYPEYTILDGVKGQGQYVGTFMALQQTADGWWGEGEIKFFIDGDSEYPTICGTGTEDYFGGAWGFGDTFSTPFLGYPLWWKEPGAVPRHALYRWHIPDPIRFKQDLRVTIQNLGGWPDRPVFLARFDDIASTAYWYQTEPHAPFPEFPSLYQRWTRNWNG
ncbi:MAG TPA: DUF2961 domain-containing protein [Candidatus Sumerlaeota bacterium]|nr:DUF2961 domain-containing protein [Candidatus Sumerlaeota bacterium]HOR27199.1 DUF2961 domain-containing protein [Candidatus Sumerlaeota bacterium]HPK02182.1 DUF2961 domain-containing protein [Candidatus Sumerlaeota bacterium]